VPLNLVVPDYQSIDAILLAMLTALVGFAIPAFSQDKPANNLEIIHENSRRRNPRVGYWICPPADWVNLR
jgi:hypothetical protein